MGNLSLICECSRSQSLFQSVFSGGAVGLEWLGGVGGGASLRLLSFLWRFILIFSHCSE